jgi:hypothetical protein
MVTYSPDQIITRQTAEQVAEAFGRAADIISAAYNQLSDAQTILESVLGDSVGYGRMTVAGQWTRIVWDHRKPQEFISELMISLKRAAWRRIFEIVQIDKVLSQKRQSQLEERLEHGSMPEVTTENIYAELMTFLQDQDAIYLDLVKEVYDILVPDPESWHRRKYKTNQNWKIPHKVILVNYLHTTHDSWGVEYGTQHYRLQAIDRLFHLLDGAGIPDGYNGELIDAIKTANHDGHCETEYFKMRLYFNGNIHLTFKRPDLVARLNKITGDGSLPGKDN